MNTKERVVVIRNPVSSHAKEVRANVMDRLVDHLPTSQVIELWTPSANRVEIADAIAGEIRAGDNIIVAAGDGTGNAAVNAYIQANVEGTKLGFLPYGNFNDMAATFTDKAAQIDPLRLLQDATGQATLCPLEVIKNGEHVWYAALYATLGWSAVAASLFDQPEVRRGLRAGKANLATNLADIAKMYFKTRKTSSLPEFYRERDDSSHTTTTDILAINGPIMAKIIRSQVPFYERDDFLSIDLDVSKVIKNIEFLGRSGLNLVGGTTLQLPGERVSHDTLRFNNASVPIQMDGEFMQLQEVEELSLAKKRSTPAITILKTTR